MKNHFNNGLTLCVVSFFMLFHSATWAQQSELLITKNDQEVPIFIKGKQGQNLTATTTSSSRSINHERTAFDFLKKYQKVLQLTKPTKEFREKKTIKDAKGNIHIRLDQYWNDIPVWKSQVVVHANAKGVYAFNGRYHPNLKITETQSKISKSAAIGIVEENLGKEHCVLPSFLKGLIQHDEIETSQLVYDYDDKTQKAKLVWKVEMTTKDLEHWMFTIDADNGKILEKHKHTCALHGPGPATAKAKDLFGVERTVHTFDTGERYFLLDGSRPMFNPNSIVPGGERGMIRTFDARLSPSNIDSIYSNSIYLTSSNNTWSNPAAVSVQYHAGLTYDYFYNTFGRNSIDGQGGNITAFVNVDIENNARWLHGSQIMLFGYGRSIFKEGSLAKSLDITAHEMAHGVIGNTADLVYRIQSGALNESFADIFAVMVDQDDWTLGEDIVNPAFFRSGSLRNLANPNNGARHLEPGWQPDHMDQFVDTDLDNGGVHINSGIPNHAFYLFATNIGKEKAEQVYYKALNEYLVPLSQFVDCRMAVIQAALDLYGTTDARAAAAAFDAVGILGSDILPDPLTEITAGKYRIRNVWKKDYLNQSDNYEGAPVTVYDSNEDWWSQIWDIQEGPDGTYRLQGAWNQRYLNCDDTPQYSSISLASFNQNWWSQMWHIEPVGDGAFRLKNRWSERYLSRYDSEYIFTDDLNENWTSQQWIFEPVTTNYSPPSQTNSLLANPNTNSSTVQTYEYLKNFKQQPDQCLVLGQELGWNLDQYDELIHALENQTGQKLGLVGGQMRNSTDEIDYPTFIEFCKEWQEKGGLLELSMIPKNPWTGGNIWDVSETDIQKLVSPGQDGYQQWRAELDFFAGILKELEQAGVTVIWRPLHEMNGNWFWYGAHGTSNPQPYIDLYRDLFNYYTNTWQLNNLIWVYSPNYAYANNVPSVTHYYPGADVVDMTGLDAYINQVAIPIDQYQAMIALDKPFSLPEFGPSANDMNGEHDYEASTNTIINRFPEVIYAKAWHDWPEHKAAWVSNRNYRAAFEFPCIVNREELGRQLTSTVEQTSIRDAISDAFQENTITFNNSSDLTMRLFPNPALTSTIVSFSDATIIKEINLFNISGQRMSINRQPVQSNAYEVSWEELPTGLYFIKVETESVPIISKIYID